jgi:competence protein ComEA
MDATPPTPAPIPPPAVTPRAAQVALGVFLAVTLGLLAFRGYGSWLGARPTETAPPALLDLNTADTAQLQQVPGIGPALAKEIAADREKRGPFGSVEELRRVKGIGPVTFDKVRGFVRVEALSESPPRTSTVPEPMVLERKPRTPPAAAPYPRLGGSSKKLQPGDPPVNINTAPVEQLMRLPGIGTVTANNIIAARSLKPFRTFADVDAVKGIGPKTLEKLRPFIVFE